jgi:hypothetical protein
MKYIAILLLGCFTFILPSYSQTTLPEDFIEEVLPYSFEKPVGITFSSRGQAFVWEKEGKVWTLDQNDIRSDQPLIDISEEVTSFGDHGLVGFALPQISLKPAMFTYTTLSIVTT